MKRSVLGALALAIACPLSMPAVAQDAEAAVDARELETARQIIAVMFPPDKRDAMMRQLMGDLTQQFGASIDIDAVPDRGLQAIFREYLDGIPADLMPVTREHFPAMLEASAIAYASEFSQAELDELLEFARTPAGEHYFAKVSSLTGHPAVAEANTRYFIAVQELNTQLQSDLSERVQSYLAKNPEVAERLAQQAGAATK